MSIVSRTKGFKQYINNELLIFYFELCVMALITYGSRITVNMSSIKIRKQTLANFENDWKTLMESLKPLNATNRIQRIFGAQIH